MELSEALDKYIDQESLYRTEGRKGVENLCTIVSAIGYRDPQHWGQFSSRASFGDLITFFEDNPGAITAVLEWIGDQDVSEWTEELQSNLPEEEEEDQDETVEQ